jgi:hypothetical protein
VRISVKMHLQDASIVFVARGRKIVLNLPTSKKCRILPVKDIDCSLGILLCREYDRPEPARTTIRTKSNVSTDYSARLPEEILEVLPLAVKWELEPRLSGGTGFKSRPCLHCRRKDCGMSMMTRLLPRIQRRMNSPSPPIEHGHFWRGF